MADARRKIDSRLLLVAEVEEPVRRSKTRREHIHVGSGISSLKSTVYESPSEAVELCHSKINTTRSLDYYAKPAVSQIEAILNCNASDSHDIWQIENYCGLHYCRVNRAIDVANNKT